MPGKWAQIWAVTAAVSLASATGFAQQNPHKKLRFDCEACHTTSSFRKIIFDHAKRTDFPLEGHHQKLACRDCHNIADFSSKGNRCFACHDDVHRARLGGDCARCHQAEGWTLFDAEAIHSRSNFPMLGRHALVDCESCHRGLPQGDLALASQRCESCHRDQYMETANPNHVQNGFSTRCEECHQMNGWQPAFFPNHDGFFPIFSGNHAQVWQSCQTCHTTGQFAEFSCFEGCHEHARAGTDARHSGMGGYRYESRACYDCHPSGEGGGAAGNHDAEFFPIFSGSHAGQWQQCADCHVTAGNFKQFSCIDCHAHTQAKTDPAHQGIAGYRFASADCYFCHPRGDRGEFREHDSLFFPIFSGKHRGKWNSCAECHPSPTDRKVFTCIDCHAHSKSKMDDKHLGEVSGYRYDSQACYDCHPKGKEDD